MSKIQREKDAAYIELETIRRNNRGILRPKDVVNYASNPSSALYCYFCWDNTKAAEEYRLWQARELIGVYVTVLKPDTKAVRAFVSLKKDRKKIGGGYRSIENVLKSPSLRKSLLKQALSEMEYWRLKYEALKELSPIFDALSKVKKIATPK
jgi:hypothetical protein